MLTPSFHSNEQMLIMCEKPEECIGQGEFDISPYITPCAFNIICGKIFILLII